MSDGSWTRWRRQAWAVARHELGRALLGRRVLPVLLLVGMPLSLAGLRALFLPVSQRADLSHSTADFAQIFALFHLRFVVFFACAVLFAKLFRGEILERSLHYSLLAPVRREVLVAGKYVGGVIAAWLVLLSTTALTFVLFHLPHGAAGIHQVLSAHRRLPPRRVPGSGGSRLLRLRRAVPAGRPLLRQSHGPRAALPRLGGRHSVPFGLSALDGSNGFTIKGGRFLSALGYQNEKHPHAWDFADNNLVYRALFGESYAQDGLQLKWVAPCDLFIETFVEIGRGANFPGTDRNGDGVGAVVAGVHLGGDFGVSNSWRAGISYLATDAKGRAYEGHDPDDVEVMGDFSGDSDTWLVDFVWKWAPDGNATERNLKLAAEYFWRDESGKLGCDDADPLEPSNCSGGVSGPYRSEQSGLYAFEKHEDRFLRLLWPKCSLVIDADDSREKGYGRYYTRQRPLTAAALKEAEGYRSDSPKRSAHTAWSRLSSLVLAEYSYTLGAKSSAFSSDKVASWVMPAEDARRIKLRPPQEGRRVLGEVASAFASILLDQLGYR